MEMVPSPKLRCLLCQRSGETEVTGPLLSKVDVTAHQNCLLFSSGIYCTDSPLFDDLFGFSVEDVMDEVCAKCKKRGATAGCEVKNCSKCYHYPCAIEDVAETVVDSVKGKYQLFCLKHGPGQQQRKGPSSNEGDPPGSASDAKSGSQSKRELILADAETNTPSKKKKILSISSSSGEEEDPGKSLAPIQDSDLDEDLNLKPCPPDGRRNSANSTVSSKGQLMTDESPPHRDGESPSLLSSEKTPARMSRVKRRVYRAAARAPDAALFLNGCNTAGCTDAIFAEFLSDMKDVSLRIRRGHASPEDHEVAFKVLMASGKMTELLSKQHKELEQKHKAMQEVMSLLRR